MRKSLIFHDKAFMYYRILLSLLVIFFASCRPSGKKNALPITTFDTTFLKANWHSNNTDSIILLTNKHLSLLLKTKDFNYYIKLSRWMAQALLLAGHYKESANFYHNIILLESEASQDFLLLKEVVNANYQWAVEIGIRKFNRYDDSIVAQTEKAISLNNKVHTLSIEDEKYAYQCLGIAYSKIGDYNKSLIYNNLQRVHIDTAKHNGLAKNSINKAIAFTELGLIDSAISISKKTLLYKDLSPLKRADLLTILCNALLHNKNYAEGEKAINIALGILDTISDKDSEYWGKKAMGLKQKSILERLNKNITGSIAIAHTAIDAQIHSNSKKDRTLAKIYIETGKGYELNKQYDSALQYYHLALYNVISIDSFNLYSLPAEDKLISENTIAEALDAIANLLLTKQYTSVNTKFIELAINAYYLSSIVDEKIIRNFSYDQSRLTLLAKSRERSEKAIQSCYTLWLEKQDIKWVKMAYLFAEKNKSIVLLESLKRNIATNTLLLKDSLFQKVQTLQISVAATEKMIALQNEKSDVEAKLSLIHQLNSYNKQLLLARNELLQKNHSLKELLQQENNINADIVQKNLTESHTSVLEYFVGDSSFFVFTISKNEPIQIAKINTAIKKEVLSFLGFFMDKNKINNNPVSFQQVSFSLYKTIIPKNIPKETTHLIIIPDGYLNLNAFEAFITEIQPTSSLKNFSYLLNKFSVSYGFSAATLQNAETFTKKNATFLGVAPVFLNNERGNATLAYSNNEIDAIKKVFPSEKFYTHNNATLNNFKKQLNTSNIIHIASHAYAEPNGNAQPHIEFYDSSLYLNELYAIQANPSLVVLSACETGIGKIDKSEGAMSLARGFYYAGAKNVITSLWNVNDKSTAALFSSFYTQIQNNNYGDALHTSKLNYIKTASSEEASPYYWASFIHIGLDKTNPKNTNRSLYLILLILSMLTLFFLYKRRK